MWFLRPLGFIGLIILPMILALYLFKNKQKNVTVSSTFLWTIAQQNQRAERSIQKLRKNLLMLLQLLAAFFCVLALTGPYIRANKDINSYKLVIDNSLSMGAAEDNKTRLDLAKADAIRLVKNSAEGSRFTVIVLNATATPLVSNSTDKDYVVNELEAINQSYLPVDYNLIPDIEENESLVLFSDTGIEADNISSYTYGTAFNNCGVISLTANDDGKNTRVLCKVKNFSDETQQGQISIYADDMLYTGQNITLAPNETKDVVFTQLNSGAKEIKAQLQTNDKFTADDTRYAVITSSYETKILLTGENPFLERVLGIMPNVQLYKNEAENIENLSGYNFYVFEGKVPDILPTDGHIMLVNPDDNQLFKVEDEVEISDTNISSGLPLQLTEKIDFEVYKSKEIILPDWGKEIITSKETPVIFMGNTGKQKVVCLGFDLANSDLPLKMDFPIFIYDVLNNLFPQGAVSGGNINIGEEVELNISPVAEKVSVVLPDGDTVQIAPPFPAKAFKAEIPGIYYLEQQVNSQMIYESFGVNIPYSEEQYFNYITEGSLSEGTQIKAKYNYDLQWIFTLIAIAILIGEFALYIYKHKSNFSYLTATLRTVVIALLILTLFDPKITLPAGGVTTVFAIDASDSMTDNIAQELNFINGSLENKPEEDCVAVAVFGKNGEILSSELKEGEKLTSVSISDNSVTDIQKGTQTAVSLFKKGTGKRLVLLTDGSENSGDIISTVNNLKNQGIQIKTMGYKSTLDSEVQLKELRVPEFLTSHEANVEIVIESTVAETADLQLFTAGKMVYNSNVELKAGENYFTVNTPVDGQGYIEFMAVVKPSADKYHQNNTVYAHSYIKSASAILLLDYENSGTQLEALLKSSGVLVNRISIFAAPKTVNELNKYEAVIMADCPYYEMAEEFVTALESYVKNSAGGLLVTGGANSLAPGGYKDTVIEDILPVNMDMSDVDKKQSTAMVMVVDRSGSMSSGNYGISKLELVKEAMVRSAQTLDDSDSIGVLSFDDAFEWVISPKKIEGSIKNIENEIYSINEGGGTSIQPALEEAVNVLSGYTADSKHIILMTDGQGENNNYEPIISKALQNNISISTVAVGNDSAQDLLKYIASLAGGRYYYTDEFTDLPKIFERETLISNKKYINNEDFYPTVNGSFDIMTGIENIPQLGGYITAEKKTAADVVLTHNNIEPVLSLWQYGLGNTAVFAADVENHCVNWLATNEGQAILKNTVAKIMRTRSLDDIEADIIEKGGKNIITVQTKKDNILGITSTITGEDYRGELIFEQVSAGVFEAVSDVSEAGNYVLNLNMSTDNGSQFASSIITIDYSDEYDINNIKSGETILNKLYNNTEEINSPTDVFTDYTDKIYDKLEISVFIIILAMICLIAELTVRRFKPVMRRKAFVGEKPPKEEKIKAELKIQEVKAEQQVQSTSSILLKNKQKREK